MKLSVYGKHWLVIDENNIDQLHEDEKMHLIKLNFDNPTKEKVEEVFDKFPSTKRYFIDDDELVRFYNDLLKNRKKFYVQNTGRTGLITFMKKNNKVLLNLQRLKQNELEYLKSNPKDILKNLECIFIGSREVLGQDWANELNEWYGNILIRE